MFWYTYTVHGINIFCTGYNLIKGICISTTSTCFIFKQIICCNMMYNKKTVRNVCKKSPVLFVNRNFLYWFLYIFSIFDRIFNANFSIVYICDWFTKLPIQMLCAFVVILWKNVWTCLFLLRTDAEETTLQPAFFFFNLLWIFQVLCIDSYWWFVMRKILKKKKKKSLISTLWSAHIFIIFM